MQQPGSDALLAGASFYAFLFTFLHGLSWMSYRPC